MSDSNTLTLRFSQIQTKWDLLKQRYDSLKHNDIGDKEKEQNLLVIIDNMIKVYLQVSSNDTTTEKTLESILNSIDNSISEFRCTVTIFDFFDPDDDSLF